MCEAHRDAEKAGRIVAMEPTPRPARRAVAGVQLVLKLRGPVAGAARAPRGSRTRVIASFCALAQPADVEAVLAAWPAGGRPDR